jgi:hypothetical protein
MGLNTEERQDIIYFTGYEVEHTICYGMKTLFVVGTPPLNEILQQAENAGDIKHIYFGTSQSFNPKSNSFEEYKAWNEIIIGCLNKQFWVSLDFDVKHIDGVLESGYNEHDKFVPMISVKLPYISELNYNATLKLDDRTWGSTNPGVWTHHLQSLMNKDKFTFWDQYTDDTATK